MRNVWPLQASYRLPTIYLCRESYQWERSLLVQYRLDIVNCHHKWFLRMCVCIFWRLWLRRGQENQIAIMFQYHSISLSTHIICSCIYHICILQCFTLFWDFSVATLAVYNLGHLWIWKQMSPGKWHEAHVCVQVHQSIHLQYWLIYLLAPIYLYSTYVSTCPYISETWILKLRL